nr:hypothetical protein CFP56_05377 [Quercus suber]
MSSITIAAELALKNLSGMVYYDHSIFNEGRIYCTKLSLFARSRRVDYRHIAHSIFNVSENIFGQKDHDEIFGGLQTGETEEPKPERG